MRNDAGNRQSILCPRCRKLISTDEPRCPYCGMVNPGAWWKNVIPSSHLFDPYRIVGTIVGVNIVLYVLSLLINPSSTSLSLNPFTFLAPSSKSLLLLGASGRYPIDMFHRWWTLISANYLHGGLLHIVFNMMVLRQIAPLAVQEYGVYRMVTIYTVSGVAGYVVSYLAGVSFTIGASAAIFGVVGAILYYAKSRGGMYGQLVFRQIGGWVIGLFIFGLLVPGINNWAHGGGLVAGGLLGYLLKYREQSRETRVDRTLGGLCAALTGIVLVWAVATAFFYRFFA